MKPLSRQCSGRIGAAAVGAGAHDRSRYQHHCARDHRRRSGSIAFGLGAYRNAVKRSAGCPEPIVLVETVWTLRARYKYPKLDVLQHVEKLMGSKAYHVVDRDVVSDALETCREHSIELADVLIGEINRLAGCATTPTFDEGACQAPTFTQLQ